MSWLYLYAASWLLLAGALVMTGGGVLFLKLRLRRLGRGTARVRRYRRVRHVFWLIAGLMTLMLTSPITIYCFRVVAGGR